MTPGETLVKAMANSQSFELLQSKLDCSLQDGSTLEQPGGGRPAD